MDKVIRIAEFDSLINIATNRAMPAIVRLNFENLMSKHV